MVEGQILTPLAPSLFTSCKEFRIDHRCQEGLHPLRTELRKAAPVL